MTRWPVHTALKVSSTVSLPSDSSVLWSEDGNLFCLMKSTVLIMTPEPGINLRPMDAVKATLPKDDVIPLGWHKTMIDLGDREVAFNWNQRCIDWESRSFGSFDLSACSIAVSPTNMLTGASCVLATLTTNMDICLWYAAKNCISGPWKKVYDVTPFLIEHCEQEHPDFVTATLNAQTTCITWSPQGTFRISPAPELIASFLICGTRAGSLILLRYNQDAELEHVLTTHIAMTWIRRISCSSWTVTSPGICEADVAYATSEGSVGFIKIRQQLVSTDRVSSFAHGCTIQTTVEKNILVYSPTFPVNVSAVQWLEIPNGNKILLHCRPGTLHLWADVSSQGWSGHCDLRLNTFHPVTGVRYLHRQDALVVSFSDGSVFVVEKVSTEPSIAPPASSLNGEALSKAVVSIVKRSEDDEVHGTATRNGGFTLYTNHGIAVWVHERVSLGDFSFTGHSKHNSLFVAAQIWDDTNDDAVMQDLTTTLTAYKGYETSPIHELRSASFHLAKQEILNRVHQRVLDILKQPVVDDSSTTILHPWTGEVGPEMRREFRGSLRRSLFGWQGTNILRTRLTFADFAWKVTEDTQRDDYGEIAGNLLSTISYRNLRMIVRHLLAVASVLTVQDIPFVLRLILQSSLPNCPDDILQDSQTLSAHIQSMFPEEGSSPFGLKELCPACGSEITLQDITNGVCQNGHMWARCSVTTFILSSTDLRTCVGCTRKAFLPVSALDSSEDLPEVLRGWVVQELLQAVHRCLFCGNCFATVV